MVLGLLTAAMLPYSLPSITARHVGNLILSTVLGLYVVSPLLTDWKGPVLLIIMLAWVALLTYWYARQQAATSSPSPITARNNWRPWVVSSLVIAAAAGTLLAISIIVNIPTTWHALHYVIVNDRVALVRSGFLVTVFVGHFPSVLISARYSGQGIKTLLGLPAVDRFGIAMGWFERALVFIFVVSGQVGGAALAVTAKSLARYPALERNEVNGEYFLIGTFTSVLMAILGAVITRIALGFSPL
jgi:hypothetical protein